MPWKMTFGRLRQGLKFPRDISVQYLIEGPLRHSEDQMQNSGCL